MLTKLNIGQYYKQTFEDGSECYFLPKKVLTNGNYQGLKFSVNGRLKGKAKNQSFPEEFVSLWTVANNVDSKIIERFIH